jgi:DNA-binding response OmpR family regulator
VLIIDDDIAFRQAIAKHLERAGYEVQQAANGDDGIHAFERNPTPVVIVDIFMPGQGGLQTIDQLRRRGPTAKIVAVSGAKSVGTLDVKGHAIALGADRFLEKPFEAATLVALLAALLGVREG